MVCIILGALYAIFRIYSTVNMMKYMLPYKSIAYPRSFPH